MSDAEKCKLIESFEVQRGSRLETQTPDYAHDLNATMRAGRLLPKGIALTLIVGRNTAIATCELPDNNGGYANPVRDSDPARATFEALAAYLADG